MEDRTSNEQKILDFIDNLRPQLIKAVKNHVNSRPYNQDIQITNEFASHSSYVVEVNDLKVFVKIELETDKRIGNGWKSDEDCDF